jgi:hypothetical protein
VGVRAAVAAAVALAVLGAEPGHAGSWSQPVPVVAPSEQLPRDPEVAWGTSGGLVALAWTQIPSRLVSTESPGSGAFSPPHVLAGRAGAYDVAVDATGTAAAVFSGVEGLDPGVYYARRPQGGTFGSQIERIYDANSRVDVQVSPAGETFAVLETARCGGPSGECVEVTVQVAVKPPGAASFGPPQRVSASGGFAQEPTIVFDRNGNALLAWLDNPSGGEVHVAYALRPVGGSFGAKRELGADGPEHFTTLVRLAANARGHVVAAWEEYGPGDEPVVQGATGAIASGLGEPTTLAGPRSVAPRPAIDERGAALVAWRAGPPGKRRIDARISESGKPFGSARNIVRGRAVSLPTAIGGPRGWSVFWRVGAQYSARGQSLHVASVRSADARPRRQLLSPPDTDQHVIANSARGETHVAWVRLGRFRTIGIDGVSGTPAEGFGRPRRIGSPARLDARIVLPRLIAGSSGRMFAYWGEPDAKPNRDAIMGAYYRP